MSESSTREKLELLSRRAALEREQLASSLWETRVEVSAFRQRWRYAGLAASGLAAAGTAAWKLFGRNSFAAKAGRIASAASLLIGLGRGVAPLPNDVAIRIELERPARAQPEARRDADVPSRVHGDIPGCSAAHVAQPHPDLVPAGCTASRRAVAAPPVSADRAVRRRAMSPVAGTR